MAPPAIATGYKASGVKCQIADSEAFHIEAARSIGIIT